MNRVSVLLIDDDEVFTRTLARSLERHGYRVSTVNRTDDIWAAIQERPFDYVLLDLMLGETSSIGLIGSICDAQPTARVIMLTGYASIPATVQAVRSGAVNLLTKPVGVSEVLAALRDAAQPASVDTATLPEPERLGLKILEWEHIQRVLAEHGGNISATARALGMHRRTLQRKLLKKPPVR